MNSPKNPGVAHYSPGDRVGAAPVTSDRSYVEEEIEAQKPSVNETPRETLRETSRVIRIEKIKKLPGNPGLLSFETHRHLILRGREAVVSKER